jgi:hypothetical protein
MIDNFQYDGITLPDDNDNVEADGNIVTAVKADGVTYWEKEVAAPITAEIMILPSVNSVGPFGTFAQLLNTRVIGGHSFSDMNKGITTRVFNIQGGDGGPYTVNISLLVEAFVIEACPTGTESEKQTLHSGTTTFNSVPSGEPNTSLVQIAGSPSWTGNSNYNSATGTWSPTTDNGFSLVQLTGVITISDGSANTVMYL